MLAVVLEDDEKVLWRQRLRRPVSAIAHDEADLFPMTWGNDAPVDLGPTRRGIWVIDENSGGINLAVARCLAECRSLHIDPAQYR
jgi:hypothetical protein